MSATAARLLNRVLEGESWARERLSTHAGRTFTVRVGPASQSFRIMASGQLESATGARETGLSDTSLRVSPLRLPSLLAEPRRWNEWVTASGDAALTATLADLAQASPWFIEAMLGRALGPIVGRRAADLGRRALAFPQHAAERVSASFSSYAHDEVAPRFGVSRDEARDFSDAVANAAVRVSTLEQRIERLTRQSAPLPTTR